MSIDREKVRQTIRELLAKALVAIVKLVKTKLIPKVYERYCKYLQKGADKIIEKSNDTIDKLDTATTTKKRIKYLYGLKLMSETMSTIGEALTTAATHIIDEVDFTEIDAPDGEDAKKAIEELDTLANAADCGPDGCDIA